MPRGLVFDWHTHDEHQVAWAPTGVLMVRTASTAWVLPPTRALWIPAGIRHETLSTSLATMRAVYVRPHLCPISWTDCTPVATGTLFAELIGYLANPDLDPAARARGEAVVVDLLRPVTMATIEVPMPQRGTSARSGRGTPSLACRQQDASRVGPRRGRERPHARPGVPCGHRPFLRAVADPAPPERRAGGPCGRCSGQHGRARRWLRVHERLRRGVPEGDRSHPVHVLRLDKRANVTNAPTLRQSTQPAASLREGLSRSSG